MTFLSAQVETTINFETNTSLMGDKHFGVQFHMSTQGFQQRHVLIRHRK